MQITRTANKSKPDSRGLSKKLSDCGCSPANVFLDQFDRGTLVLSSLMGTMGIHVGGSIGAPAGAAWGRQIASALTTGGAANPEFFPNLVLGGKIGTVAGSVALAAVGFAAVTAGTYVLLKAGEG